jgi:hypothetical protein
VTRALGAPVTRTPGPAALALAVSVPLTVCHCQRPPPLSLRVSHAPLARAILSSPLSERPGHRPVRRRALAPHAASCAGASCGRRTLSDPQREADSDASSEADSEAARSVAACAHWKGPPSARSRGRLQPARLQKPKGGVVGGPMAPAGGHGGCQLVGATRVQGVARAACKGRGASSSARWHVCLRLRRHSSRSLAPPPRRALACMYLEPRELSNGVH